jgi:hypothetical protein
VGVRRARTRRQAPSGVREGAERVGHLLVGLRPLVGRLLFGGVEVGVRLLDRALEQVAQVGLRARAYGLDLQLLLADRDLAPAAAAAVEALEDVLDPFGWRPTRGTVSAWPTVPASATSRSTT